MYFIWRDRLVHYSFIDLANLGHHEMPRNLFLKLAVAAVNRVLATLCLVPFLTAPLTYFLEPTCSGFLTKAPIFVTCLYLLKRSYSEWEMTNVSSTSGQWTAESWWPYHQLLPFSIHSCKSTSFSLCWVLIFTVVVLGSISWTRAPFPPQ